MIFLHRALINSDLLKWAYFFNHPVQLPLRFSPVAFKMIKKFVLIRFFRSDLVFRNAAYTLYTLYTFNPLFRLCLSSCRSMMRIQHPSWSERVSESEMNTGQRANPPHSGLLRPPISLRYSTPRNLPVARPNHSFRHWTFYFATQSFCVGNAPT